MFCPTSQIILYMRSLNESLIVFRFLKACCSIAHCRFALHICYLVQFLHILMTKLHPKHLFEGSLEDTCSAFCALHLRWFDFIVLITFEDLLRFLRSHSAVQMFPL